VDNYRVDNYHMADGDVGSDRPNCRQLGPTDHTERAAARFCGPWPGNANNTSADPTRCPVQASICIGVSRMSVAVEFDPYGLQSLPLDKTRTVPGRCMPSDRRW
jgi:hypothetical protein